jgi:uncharacterized protein DUF2855
LGTTAQRIMVATLRDNVQETEVLHDELPALEPDEIRLRVDKVGLSANNLFYAQMGEAPFLKFFAVYPLDEEYKHLANVPAWGVATITESRNPDFSVGEQYRGFLHMANVVQMKARRTEDGFVAYGGKRDKLNQAYNGFIGVDQSGSSPIKGDGEKSDLAMTSAPGGLSGFILYELLKMHSFYGGNSVVLTSASSKLSLTTALLLRRDREEGALAKVIAYTAKSNVEFVRSTGLYDEILTYDEALPGGPELQHVLIDVAGDAAIYKRGKEQIIKAFAVGGTHSSADASIFTAFRPSGFLKMFIDMVAPQAIKSWASRNLNPRLEMFFAPTVINELLSSWGKEEMERKSDDALGRFVDAAVDGGWIKVDRSESVEDIQAAYKNIVLGLVPPAEAVILSLSARS